MSSAQSTSEQERPVAQSPKRFPWHVIALVGNLAAMALLAYYLVYVMSRRAVLGDAVPIFVMWGVLGLFLVAVMWFEWSQIRRNDHRSGQVSRARIAVGDRVRLRGRKGQGEDLVVVQAMTRRVLVRDSDGNKMTLALREVTVRAS